MKHPKFICLIIGHKTPDKTLCEWHCIRCGKNYSLWEELKIERRIKNGV